MQNKNVNQDLIESDFYFWLEEPNEGVQLPSVVDLWSSLLRERLLLMKGAADREEVCRDEKLRLLARRKPDRAVRDACVPMGPPASLLVRLRLRLLTPTAWFPARSSGAADEARCFGERGWCLIEGRKVV